MKEDPTLLREFVISGSEAAFAELVQRHIHLVYSCALRQLKGDSHRAEDATQAVFCELSRKASQLLSYRSLSGWLYNATRFIATRLLRGETRRANREKAYVMNQNSDSGPPEPSWREIEQVLDDAMQDLSEKDREAVLLRYFQNAPLATIGVVIGASENTTRMRVERALEKLRVALGRRGIKSSAGVLGGSLAANAIISAPASLGASLLGPALASSAGAAVTGFNLLHFMASIKMKTAMVGLALTGVTTGYFVAHQQEKQLRSELAASEQRNLAMKREIASANPSKGDVDPRELSRFREEHSELLRLRGEITQLRQQQAEALRAIKPAGDAVPRREITPQQQKEVFNALGLAKMNLSKAWGVAFLLYAQEHQGKMPESFFDAAQHFPNLPEEMNWIVSLASPNDFEIVFQGTLLEIENPAQAIILREKEPFHIEDSGAARRTYLFADGHTEVHLAPQGNFDVWEKEHVPRLKTARQNENLEGR